MSPREDPKTWFRICDQDGDRRLSREEVLSALKAQLPLDNRALERFRSDEAAWRSWDQDGSGFIEYVEIMEPERGLLKRLGSHNSRRLARRSGGFHNMFSSIWDGTMLILLGSFWQAFGQVFDRVLMDVRFIRDAFSAQAERPVPDLRKDREGWYRRGNVPKMLEKSIVFQHFRAIFDAFRVEDGHPKRFYSPKDPESPIVGAVLWAVFLFFFFFFFLGGFPGTEWAQALG